MKKMSKILKAFVMVVFASVVSVLAVACGGTTEEAKSLDLTKMSSTMAYSTVGNINASPDKYSGKEIKVSGIVSVYYNDKTKTTYYSVGIYDEGSCCTENIEFKMMQGKSYPEDGDEITLKGELGTYEENGKTYAYISNAKKIKTA